MSLLTPRLISRNASAASSAPSTPASHFSSLSAQVGGHPGVLESDDGAVVVKPALHAEATFYTRLSEGDSALEKLRPHVPAFYGTLSLAGEAAPEGIEAGLHPSPADIPEVEKESIVLQNVANSFSKPNILDIKLGTVLYDDGASPEKRERMIKAARETTSLETGVRMTGFQVYDYTSHAPINTPKSYGKSIRVDELPEAMRRFFPVNTSEAAANFASSNANLSPATESNALGLSDDTEKPQPTTHSCLEPQGSGLPAPLLLATLRGILARVQAIRAALAETELRLVGSSLLIVYEADWTRTAALLHSPVISEEEDVGHGAKADLAGEDAEVTIAIEEDGYIEDDEGELGDGSNGEDSDEEEEASPYKVALIDFAHTKIVPGEGPDERVLLGVDTTIRLLEGRLAEVASMSSKSTLQ